MEVVNYWYLLCKELNEFINFNDLGNRVVVLNDGELLIFEK